MVWARFLNWSPNTEGSDHGTVQSAYMPQLWGRLHAGPVQRVASGVLHQARVPRSQQSHQPGEVAREEPRLLLRAGQRQTRPDLAVCAPRLLTPLQAQTAQVRPCCCVTRFRYWTIPSARRCCRNSRGNNWRSCPPRSPGRDPALLRCARGVTRSRLLATRCGSCTCDARCRRCVTRCHWGSLARGVWQ